MSATSSSYMTISATNPTINWYPTFTYTTSDSSSYALKDSRKKSNIKNLKYLLARKQSFNCNLTENQFDIKNEVIKCMSEQETGKGSIQWSNNLVLTLDDKICRLDIRTP